MFSVSIFSRQEICDALKTAGFDINTLSDPLGTIVDSSSDGLRKPAELDAESIQISISDDLDCAPKSKANTVSFADIYKAYRSVPQVYLLLRNIRYVFVY